MGWALMPGKNNKNIDRIWMVAREYGVIAGAGGVKDVLVGLSEAFARKGLSVKAIIPCYGFIDPDDLDFISMGIRFEVDMNYAHMERRETVRFFSKNINGVELILVDSPRFSEKLSVYTYTKKEEAKKFFFKTGAGHHDYCAMNILLQKAALGLAVSLNEHPGCIHCHDGHAACVPAIMREFEGYRNYFKDTNALVTIHNAGVGYHQEVADIPFAKAVTGLPSSVISSNILNGAFDPLLACSSYCPVNTVSENYAKELQETGLDVMTGGLGHALRERGKVLEGITNGINPEDYDPRAPEKLGLPAPFDPGAGDLKGKAECRRMLAGLIRDEKEINGLKKVGYIEDDPEAPLFAVVSRLTEQKGMDALADAMDDLFEEEDKIQLVILGTGSKEIEDHLIDLSKRPSTLGRMSLLLGYSPYHANIIYGASDFLVIPSRYEPCGLTDFMAQLLGCLPIVHATGGLVKVLDGFNGFSYYGHDPSLLKETIKKALALYRTSRETLTQMVINAVKHINERYSWDKVSDQYMELYKKEFGA